MEKQKEAQIAQADSGSVSREQLEAINRHTRRALQAEEVYTFSLLLCDNEVDRDHERFDDEALDTLAGLFVGKTGVFDHNPTAENQSARIFETQVLEEPGRTNTLGEPYRYLKGWAYMLRSGKTADLILEIDGGIKKEVSVGCAVAEIRCSACGADQRQGGCEHRKGGRYGQAVCHHILSRPTDAYEWSFVAVPAQKNAGVTKRRIPQQATAGFPVDLDKLFQGGGELTVHRTQLEKWAARYREQEEMAQAGQAYLEELRRDVVRMALLCQPAMEPQVMEEVAAAMSLRQLKAFQKGYAPQMQKKYPVPQLAGIEAKGEDGGMAAFKM